MMTTSTTDANSVTESTTTSTESANVESTTISAKAKAETESDTTTTSATNAKAITTTTKESATTSETELTTTTEATEIIAEEVTTTSNTESVEKSVVEHIASDEELENWSVNDYNIKHEAIIADSAEITETSDGKYQITLKDKSDNVLDVYEINPEDGIGTDSADGEVNLPQTGNNSLINLLTALGALAMTAAGFISVKSSGIIRRKRNNK
ncbi:MAG: LPXTG cell wall anchor domain-containing protein [Ruminococcus sp.]|nr:LPXTG cell wall anchor domain-containing protein [Ruminococcus sp.]